MCTSFEARLPVGITQASRTILNDDLMNIAALKTWPFEGAGHLSSCSSKPTTRVGRLVRVSGRFRTDSMSAVHAAACHGLGIGYGPFWQIRDLFDRGALEIALDDF